MAAADAAAAYEAAAVADDELAACEGCDVVDSAPVEEASPPSEATAEVAWLLLALIDFSTLMDAGDSTLVCMIS